jgi:hypothetical protein
MNSDTGSDSDLRHRCVPKFCAGNIIRSQTNDIQDSKSHRSSAVSHHSPFSSRLTSVYGFFFGVHTLANTNEEEKEGE